MSHHAYDFHPEDYDGTEDVYDEVAEERAYTIAMITCPYFWSGQLDRPTCRNGCWEEPACHTGGPYDFPPDWPAERALAKAVDRQINEREPV